MEARRTTPALGVLDLLAGGSRGSRVPGGSGGALAPGARGVAGTVEDPGRPRRADGAGKRIGPVAGGARGICGCGARHSSGAGGAVAAGAGRDGHVARGGCSRHGRRRRRGIRRAGVDAALATVSLESTAGAVSESARTAMFDVLGAWIVTSDRAAGSQWYGPCGARNLHPPCTVTPPTSETASTSSPAPRTPAPRTMKRAEARAAPMVAQGVDVVAPHALRPRLRARRRRPSRD